MIARLAQHVLGDVQAYDAACREQSAQLKCQAPSAASGIEHGLVSLERKLGQHLLAPGELRRGNAMISGCVPFAGSGARLVIHTKWQP